MKKEVAKSKKLAVREQCQPAPQEQVKITAEDITKYLCPAATPKEVFMALNIIKSFGLNPFKREVHIIKYGSNPAQVVVGYEVYLKRAERTGRLNGFRVELSENGQIATCTIYRKDWKEPFVWTTDRREFDKGQASWKTMGSFMIKKVCMAQAFRICFSDEMGGMPYTSEEISTFIPEHNGKTLPAEPIEHKVSIPAEPEDANIVEPKKEVKYKVPAETQREIASFLEDKPEKPEAEKVSDTITAIVTKGKQLKLSKDQFLDIMEKSLGLRDDGWRSWNDLGVLNNFYNALIQEELQRKIRK